MKYVCRKFQTAEHRPNKKFIITQGRDFLCVRKTPTKHCTCWSAARRSAASLLSHAKGLQEGLGFGAGGRGGQKSGFISWNQSKCFVVFFASWHLPTLLTQRCRLLALYDLNLHPFGRFCGIDDYTRLSPPSRTASDICKEIIIKAYINLGKLTLNSSNSLFLFFIRIFSTPSAVFSIRAPSS